MDATYTHLNDEARKAIELSDEERVRFVRRGRWIGYSRAIEILDELEDLFTHPPMHRMPNLLIVSPTNNGKTMIAKRFLARHPSSANPRGDAMHVPVLLVEIPPVPDESRLYDNILEALGAPFKTSDDPSKKEFQVHSQLKRVGLRMLMLDEVHNMLAGSAKKRMVFANVLRRLGNRLEAPIVGLGIADAVRAVNNDRQLANRFTPMYLPRWKLDDEFYRLLASFERMLPLKQPSNLIAHAIATKLYAMSEGVIGELDRVLKKAAVHAIRTGTERIDEKVLGGFRWTQPSARKLKAEAAIQES